MALVPHHAPGAYLGHYYHPYYYHPSYHPYYHPHYHPYYHPYGHGPVMIYPGYPREEDEVLEYRKK